MDAYKEFLQRTRRLVESLPEPSGATPGNLRTATEMWLADDLEFWDSAANLDRRGPALPGESKERHEYMAGLNDAQVVAYIAAKEGGANEVEARRAAL